MVGRKESQSVLLTLDERTTRFRHIIKIPGRSIQAVEQGGKALRELYGERFNQVFRSITSEIPIYYAHPYSAYERGLNEKQNSLIRRFLPGLDQSAPPKILSLQFAGGTISDCPT